MIKQKLNRLISSIETHKLDAIALNPGPSLAYLTGLQFHLMERPVILIIAPPKEPVLILPKLELNKAEPISNDVQCIPYEDAPDTWQDIFNKVFQDLKLDHCSIGVEPNHMRLLEYRMLEVAAPQASFIPAEAVMSDLRIQKDETEIYKMRKAVEIAQNALQNLIKTIKPGMTELEIASELTVQMLREGADSELPFAPIVASGPNAANPHAVPTSRKICPGDLLLIDYGASFEGYLSDITRTFAIQKVDPKLQKIAQIVIDANAAGRSAACKSGITASEIDRATREVIEKAGYGEYFTHRTGHGLGMEAHEPPFIHGNNSLKLETGMVFTIEPGIYLPGSGGVRFEDDIVKTQDGAESLTSLPRKLLEIG